MLHHASSFIPYASCIMHCREEAEIWYVDCSHKYKINHWLMVGGRWTLVEDDLHWKTTFVGRQPSLEDNLQWKTAFSRRHPLLEDKLWWGDDLWWKTTFGARQRLVEDFLWWKTNFDGRRPSVEDNPRWILACCLLSFEAFFFVAECIFCSMLVLLQNYLNYQCMAIY